MKILSLFDGIGCAYQAALRVGLEVEVYDASEVDKYAIQVASNNIPIYNNIGDVKEVSDFPYVYDLLIGGSPCQDLSIAKKGRQGLKGERSSLFWEYVRILKEAKPKYFVLENVASMKKEDRDIITETLGVEPIMINATLVSAQQRKRLFWTNIPNIDQPEDRGIYLIDILEDEVDAKYNVNISEKHGLNMHKGYGSDGVTLVNSTIRIGKFNNGGQGDRFYSPEGKSVCLSAHGGGRGAKTGLYLIKPSIIRKLTPIECERLQGLPDNYTQGLSNTQRYKCLGNAFNVDVVAHILKSIKL